MSPQSAKISRVEGLESPLGTSFIRRKSSEIRKLFPNSPQKCISVLKHIWDQMYKSPRKRHYIRKLWPLDQKEFAAFMLKVGKHRAKKDIRKLKKAVDDIKQKYNSLRQASKFTPYSWTQFRHFMSVKSVCHRKLEYSHKLSSTAIHAIQNHMESEEVSFPLPDHKFAGKRFMRTSMKNALNMYNISEATKRPVSLATLYRYQPKHVKLKGKIPLRQSCCERCLNFDYIANQSSKYLNGTNKDLNEAVDSTLCKYTGRFPNIGCILRTCDECGTQKLKESLYTQNAAKLEDNRKRFLVKQWVNKTRERNGATQSYLQWDVERCSYSDLIDKYVDILDAMAEHVFMASWNYCQFKAAKQNILHGEVVVVHDFAQNYLCLLQNEPQGMHWEHKQVTLHPSVAFYKCPNDCTKLVMHEVVHVSDDLKHDAHLVRRFHDVTMNVLRKRKIPIRKIIQFTDQAPSQYKNKSAFRYAAHCDLLTMLNFFGVRHGKGPCDACAGRVKQQISSLVKTEEVTINSAREFFDACKEHLETRHTEGCVHFLQTFEFTNKIANRPNTKKWTSVPDTRKIHSITNVPKKGVINIRNFLCCCNGCIHGDGPCTNEVCPDRWRTYDLQKKKFVPTKMWLWDVCLTRKIIPLQSNNNYWADQIEELSKITSFDVLKHHIHSNVLPPFTYEKDITMSENDRNHLDFVALHYLPSDAPDSFAPISIIGDGNCFCRAVSYALFRTQNRYHEIRTRIIYESVQNMDKYLDTHYAEHGANHFYRRGSLVEQYAMYSDNYRPQEPLDVQKIYMKEVLDICKDGAFMGVWQLFQLANVLHCPVRSVYPEGGNANIRLDLNQVMWCINENFNSTDPFVVMWTPMQVGNGRPCHFVPLLKVVRYFTM